jgi:hypothetical protein
MQAATLGCVNIQDGAVHLEREANVSIVERFWSKVDKSSGDAGCWLWLAGKDKDGYGKYCYRVGRKIVDTRAHRFVMELGGSALGTMYALHKCDTPACVNPAHLFAGTAKDNALDCSAKGRTLTGRRNSKPRSLSEADVAAIRLAASGGESHSSIAKRYPVQRRQISRVAQGVRYAWVSDPDRDL